MHLYKGTYYFSFDFLDRFLVHLMQNEEMHKHKVMTIFLMINTSIDNRRKHDEKLPDFS